MNDVDAPTYIRTYIYVYMYVQFEGRQADAARRHHATPCGNYVNATHTNWKSKPTESADSVASLKRTKRLEL